MAIVKKIKAEKGILIVEILIVVAVVSIALVSLLGAAVFSLKISLLTKQNDQAKKLAEEALETVRNLRDGTDWDVDGLGALALAPVSYHPEKTMDDPPAWDLVLGDETIGIFERKIIFSSVQRDVNDNIVQSGGADDPNTKKVTATVSWGNRKVEITTYLTNWK